MIRSHAPHLAAVSHDKTSSLPSDPPPSAPAAVSGHTLPPGTVIGGLTISGLIGEGGFGIVYLAFDPTLQRQVALKEYMPTTLAARGQNSSEVTVRSVDYIDTFNAGLRSFVNEARLLARFDHPALVKVHQFWQANRTAYMVMPFYQGSTLKAHIKAELAQGRHPDEAQLRAWLAPLLDALEVMHAEQCYHRDIAPDNILLTPSGPLLLDFGAARRVISDMTQALTVILKPGYAPIEQYGEAASMTQGPWTDLYALASVIYFTITGHSPITSVERMMGDPLPRLAEEANGKYGQTFLTAIDAALAVRPQDRPQSVAEFRALLAGTATPRPVTMVERTTLPMPPVPMAPEPTPAPVVDGAGRWKAIVGVAMLAGVAFVGGGWFMGRSAPPAAPPAAAPPAPVAVPLAPVAAPPVAAALPAPVAPASAAVAAGVVPPSTEVVEPAKGKAGAALAKPVPVAPPAARAATTVAAPPLAASLTPSAATIPTVTPAAPPKPARCGELMQKGQQGTLSLEEAIFLRNECR
ncbi:MAG: serine/threonine protein kinase [Burkholderiales bacterium]|nr:serine/threonine protein kinase [Burkholderiales bacterium]